MLSSEGMHNCFVVTSSSPHFRVVLRTFLHLDLDQADTCLDSLLRPPTSTISHLHNFSSLQPLHHSTQKAHSLLLHAIMASTIELPKEIWLEIVSYLDYFELKNCMRVSKIFKSYTELPTCQKTMFRSKAVVQKGGVINLDDVEIHPAFDSMSYECATELDEVFLRGRNMEAIPLTETCVAGENATDPPVAFIRFKIMDEKACQITSKNGGVTVEQVMKALCRFFSKHGSFEVTGGRTGWTGWDEIKLDRNGNILLDAYWFDS